MQTHPDVLIIGAGPAGCSAAANLLKQGKTVTILEKSTFPRFVIGESLLPQCMDLLDEAGLLEVVQSAGFQRKDGAFFDANGVIAVFNFSERFSEGWNYTYQVQRERFDTLLADTVMERGAEIYFKHCVSSVSFPSEERVIVECKNSENEVFEFRPRFLLDASGNGRVLPRLLGTDRPSGFPVRQAAFTHILEDHREGEYDDSHILIALHPEKTGVWYWMIPFEDGGTSIGVVGTTEDLHFEEGKAEECLKSMINETPCVRTPEFSRPVMSAKGYSSSVSQMFGDRYALLGNAADFLDPVFSSGITIALKSASLASQLVTRQLNGENVNWERDFSEELCRGVDVFRTYVQGWYDGRFPKVIFIPDKPDNIPPMICSVLAGYVWDQTNPFVQNHEKRLNVLSTICS